MHAELLPMVWIAEDSRSDGIDLELIVAAEADRRVARGQLPGGVMLGPTLYRDEIARPSTAAWIRSAKRVVVCDSPNTDWIETLGPGGPEVRFLPAPFGPRSFGYLLTWLGGAPGAGAPATETPAWDEPVS